MHNFVQESYSNSFYLSHTSPQKIEEEITNWNANEASGSFKITI